MSDFERTVSLQFQKWEQRGRGTKVYPYPVEFEPPFMPFSGYSFPKQDRDDGRHETGLSRFFKKLISSDSETSPTTEPESEPEPVMRRAGECVELQLTLPFGKTFSKSSYESFLHQICRAREPFAFELLASANEIVPQFVSDGDTIERIARALPQFLPDVETLSGNEALHSEWQSSAESFVVLEVALGSEFLIPLAQAKSDILAAVVNAMEQVRDREFALYQVLIEPAVNNWAQSIPALILDTSGKPLFRNRPELASAAERKCTSTFFSAVVRFAVSAGDARRCWQIIRDIISPFAALSERGTNYLIPLPNTGYDTGAHEADILFRTSHRSGMLLNADELIGFIGFPNTSVSGRLRRQTAHTRRVPEHLQLGGSLSLGVNAHAGRIVPVCLSPSHRVRHMHLVGASGTGKSTLLFNSLRQDIESGQGIALLDPHGDLVDRVLGIIPPERRKDVVLVDPSDEENIVGFNILAAHSDFERNLLASDLVSTFRRLSTSWGEQMNSVLRNAILAFLESSRGGTLADMRRFLLDSTYRKEFLRTVSDPDIIFYWDRAFPQLTGNKSIGPVLTRLDEFLSRKPIRYMVSQNENRLDFSDILDNSRILLVKLPHGQIGRENANLLGSVIVSKIQQIAMSRQRLKEHERKDFWVYLDEFHSFITPSMAEILTGARKYHVGLVLAHQELHQLDADRDVASAVLANCCTRVVFRVSDRDARELATGFTHFESTDLQNLGVGQAICRVERSDSDFNLTVPEPEPVDEFTADESRRESERLSNDRYSRKRQDVEAELLRRTQQEHSSAAAAKMPSERPTVSEKNTPLEHPVEPPAPPTPGPPPREPETQNIVAESSVVHEAPKQVGLGRGGEDHKLIVGSLASEASRLDFRSIKECVVDGGRIDLVIETQRIRIAVEVAVHSNTAQEIENLRKCAAAKMDVIVSVSPNESIRSNVKKAAERSFDAKTFGRMRFEGADVFLEWLRQTKDSEAALAPPSEGPKEKVIAGRKVRARYAEMSEDERKKKEQENLEVIADLLKNRSSNPPSNT